ncbi:MAG TPA: enolase C-terminal domain-like protein [Xanthobacteraceae bacterium]|nr:enolase C-terminal domain-like protein [Xanthobacteraceae bacterium]
MEARARPEDRQVARAPLMIRRVDAIPVALPLNKPMKMAGVTIDRAYNLLVRIEAQDGSVGWGEAASAPTMTGDTLGGLEAAVREHLGPLLIGRDARMRPALGRSLRAALLGNSGAHSAVEMALLDLAGQAAGLPIIDLIGGAARTEVAPMWLLGNASPDQDIAEAQAKQAEGFHFFKLKIGVKPLAAEIAATHAVRAALGPDVPLCADANCGLTIAAARRYAEETRAASLAFVEQPLAHDDLAGLAALTRVSPTPIGADEAIHSLADIDAHARAGVGGVSLKLIKLGGMAAALQAAILCERQGLAVNIAAKIAESSIASAAAVHLACAVPTIDWGVSLTHFYLAEDLARRPLPMGDHGVSLPRGAGLGIEVDEDAVARFRVT